MAYWSKVPCSFDDLQQMTFDSPEYTFQSGDIGFYVFPSAEGLKFGHTLIVDPSNVAVIHSTEKLGVHSSSINPTKQIVFFRFNGMPGIAERASALAQTWSRGHHYYQDYTFEEKTSQVVGYSSFIWKRYRGVSAMFGGSSTFGPKAKARLVKYRGREEIAPKNVMCSEMVILAYQLIVVIEEESYGFISLDAKHALPGTLALYLYENPYWDLVGRKDKEGYQ